MKAIAAGWLANICEHWTDGRKLYRCAMKLPTQHGAASPSVNLR